MNKRKTEPPAWLKDALQGLAFWMGYRQALYRHYPLSEGAIVAQACSLIQANLPDDRHLYPEVMYKKLQPEKTGKEQKGQKDQTRADLVICKYSLEKHVNRKNYESIDSYSNLSKQVEYIFECKRASAGKKEIGDDFIKLYNLLQKLPEGHSVRAFLLVISEGLPAVKFGDYSKGHHLLFNEFINEKTQNARTGTRNWPINANGKEISIPYRVRRVLKSSASFKSNKRAHYVCLIEVLL